ncbi:MAG: winged helix-turn-helix domain-containing protein [Methanomassiliicoccales archaeon]|nr:winged helix-turn-helix domain-containing protein [Methanomassiliicoccales archaeon]
MKAIERLLWWLIAGSAGGVNRGRIINALREHPFNANQLTELLELDYKTVRHHIGILERNNMISSIGSGYGKMYDISFLLAENIRVFDDMWTRVENEKVGVKGHGGTIV